MDERDIKEFFDMLAEDWDAEVVVDEIKMQRILDAAGIEEGKKVLDVACGTGVMIPEYLERKVGKVVAFDFSPNMIKVAKAKFHDDPRVEFQCTDINGLQVNDTFDSVVIYNAFPHFLHPKDLIEKLAGMITIGGRLTVAHDMGIRQLNAHHSKRAKKVSNPMLETNEMANLFAAYFEVTHQVSEEDIYIVSGIKRAEKQEVNY